MRRYDWVAVQKYYDDGHSYRECIDHFGFSAAAWSNAVKRRALRARARQLAPTFYLATVKSRSSAKKRLLDEGLLAEICSGCSITHWFGEKLSLHLDHINGIRDDNRLENLRLLCPNCHSQTETFSGRNVKKNMGQI